MDKRDVATTPTYEQYKQKVSHALNGTCVDQLIIAAGSSDQLMAVGESIVERSGKSVFLVTPEGRFGELTARGTCGASGSDSVKYQAVLRNLFMTVREKTKRKPSDFTQIVSTCLGSDSAVVKDLAKEFANVAPSTDAPGGPNVAR